MILASGSQGRSRVLVGLILFATGAGFVGCGRRDGLLNSGADAAAGAGAGGHTGSAGANGDGAAGSTTDTAAASGAGGVAGVPAAGSAGGVGGGVGGAGGSTAGASGMPGEPGGAGGHMDPVPPPIIFKNYQVTGTWLKQRVAVVTKPGTLRYTKVVINNQFLAESCSIADYNNDGVPDVSSGRIWYQGPDFKMQHQFRDGHGALPRNGDSPEIDTGNSDDRADYPFDMNGDGWTDIINVAANDIDEVTKTNPKIGTVQVHDTAFWYENPGLMGTFDPKWTAHLMSADVKGEQTGLMDVNGDGYPELLAACKTCTPPTTKGYYQGDPANPTGLWKFHAVTVAYTFPFSGTGHLHGIGSGDVNADGLPDLLERGGAWLQQPDGTWNSTVCVGKGTPTGCGWIKEKTALLPSGFYDGLTDSSGWKGPSHIYAVDLDQDGLTDVLAADWAHSWGLYWYRQGADGTFTKLQFMGGSADTIPADVAKWGAGFTQPHALQVADMDGDGRLDVITGKTRFAHPRGYLDPDVDGVPFLVVFKNVAETDARTGAPITLKPVQIDPDPTPGAAGAIGTPAGGMGVGRQVAIGHVDTDGVLDICVATKVGLAVFLGK